MIFLANSSTVVTIKFLNTKTKKYTSKKYRCVVKEALKEETKFAISDVTATKVNELKVTFASPVDITKTTLAVTKNAADVESKAEFAVDGTTATITTTAKMTKGTYTVTATDGDKKDSKSVEVTDQKVEKIVILNKVALTGTRIGGADGGGDLEAGNAFIYYDVLDQYGESLKTSTSIDWTTSCDSNIGKDRTLGCLTVHRSDKKAFTYGEKIYVTGVYAKTGVTVSEELTVGANQALHNVKLEGFIKTGSSEIVHSIPAGFKENEYQLLYTVTDQNGNEMKAANYLATGSNTVTFVSNKVLVIKEIKDAGLTNVIIGGKEYCVAKIVPGINASEGGEVTIDAIATKTGNKASLTVIVGDGQILKSFDLAAPSAIIADGETAEIPFTATAQDGSEIKSFVTLASQTDFSNLTLNASEGTLKLEEKADGTAKLTWTDKAERQVWTAADTDGVSRPISLTTVVVGGSTSNLMIYVEDKARPDAISDVDIDKAYVEGATETVSLSSFDFLDQYGRKMTKKIASNKDSNTENKNKGYIYDNGFFAYANTPTAADGSNKLSGNDFAGYTFGIEVENKCDANFATLGFSPKKYMINSGSQEYFDMQTALGATGSATGEQTLKFTIAKKSNKAGSDVEGISTTKNASFRVVDLSQVSGFEVDAADKVFVETSNSDNATKSDLTATGGIAATGTFTAGADYKVTVKVNGTFNGTKVSVPAMYFNVDTNKLRVSSPALGAAYGSLATDAAKKNVIDAVTTAGIKWTDLYDATSAKNIKKDADDTIKVTLYAATGSGVSAKIDPSDTRVIDTASKKIKISDATPYAAEIIAADKVTIGSANTAITLLSGNVTTDLTTDGRLMKEAKAEGKDNIIVKDQYGVDITKVAEITAKVSGIKENADRYVLNNAKVNSNDTETTNLTGVELGDTMTVTLYAKYGDKTISKEIALTVGADSSANITKSDNNYKDTLVKTYLQPQLEIALGSK